MRERIGKRIFSVAFAMYGVGAVLCGIGVLWNDGIAAVVMYFTGGGLFFLGLIAMFFGALIGGPTVR